MHPVMRCTTCGYVRRLDLRGLLARDTDCPRCPEGPKLVLDRRSNLTGQSPEVSRALEASSKLR